MKTLCLIALSFTAIIHQCFAQQKIEERYAAALRSELLEMGGQMNQDKKNLYIVTVECGYHSREVALGKRISARHDSINMLKIRSIIHVYGYLGPKMIGSDANQVMFNIIYQSPVDTAKKFVSLLWQALQNGNTTPENYAALADKVSMQEQHAQIYGSIIQNKGGTFYMPPILDSTKVDSLRKNIGLPPLKEYIEQFAPKN